MKEIYREQIRELAEACSDLELLDLVYKLLLQEAKPEPPRGQVIALYTIREENIAA